MQFNGGYNAQQYPQQPPYGQQQYPPQPPYGQPQYPQYPQQPYGQPAYNAAPPQQMNPMAAISPGMQQYVPSVSQSLQQIITNSASLNNIRDAFYRTMSLSNFTNAAFISLLVDTITFIEMEMVRSGQPFQTLAQPMMERFVALAVAGYGKKVLMSNQNSFGNLSPETVQAMENLYNEGRAILQQIEVFANQAQQQQYPQQQLYGQQPYGQQQMYGTPPPMGRDQMIAQGYASGAYVTPIAPQQYPQYPQQQQYGQPQQQYQQNPMYQNTTSSTGRYADTSTSGVGTGNNVQSLQPGQNVLHSVLNQHKMQKDDMTQPNFVSPHVRDEISTAPDEDIRVRVNTESGQANSQPASRAKRRTIYPQTKRVMEKLGLGNRQSKVFDVNKHVAILVENNGEWRDEFISLNNSDKLEEYNVEMNYEDFENEKLITPMTPQDLEHVPNPEHVAKELDAVAMSEDLRALFTRLEAEGNVVSGQEVLVERDITIDHPIYTDSEHYDPYVLLTHALTNQQIKGKDGELLDIILDNDFDRNGVQFKILEAQSWSTNDSSLVEWMKGLTECQTYVQLANHMLAGAEYIDDYKWAVLHRQLTANMNFLLKYELCNIGSITSFVLDHKDFADGIHAMATDDNYPNITEHTIRKYARLLQPLIDMTFNMLNGDELTDLVGDVHGHNPDSYTFAKMNLYIALPMRAIELGLAFVGDKGMLTRPIMPSLYELVARTFKKSKPDVKMIRLMTRDAVEIRVYRDIEGNFNILR